MTTIGSTFTGIGGLDQAVAEQAAHALQLLDPQHKATHP